MRLKSKQLRLRNFDYSSCALYFITIVTKNRTNHFGAIENGVMRLSEIGVIARQFMSQIPKHFPQAELDEMIVMPDHVHLIIMIRWRTSGPFQFNIFGKPIKGSISVMINLYKGSVKKWCNKNGHEDFLWQPKFYDHVIKDRKELYKMRNYIRTNPIKWKEKATSSHKEKELDHRDL